MIAFPGKTDKPPTPSQHFIGKGVCPYQYAFTLLIPLRDFFLSPKKLLKRLQLKADDRVLEIGPGPGYFSPYIAKAIPEGKLILADIQPEMLEYAKKRINKRGIINVEYHLCNGKFFPYKENCFDVILLVAVLGEIENREDYIREFHRMLKPGGLLSVSELPGDPDSMSREKITKLLEVRGLKFEAFYGKGRNFTIHFRK